MSTTSGPTGALHPLHPLAILTLAITKTCARGNMERSRPPNPSHCVRRGLELLAATPAAGTTGTLRVEQRPVDTDILHLQKSTVCAHCQLAAVMQKQEHLLVSVKDRL